MGASFCSVTRKHQKLAPMGRSYRFGQAVSLGVRGVTHCEARMPAS